MLIAEVVPCMTNACLHFVEHEHHITLVAHAAQSFQVAIGRNYNPTLTLDRLDQHSTGLLRHGLFHRPQITIRYIRKTWQGRLEAFAHFLLSSCSDSTERTAMERIGRGDDVGTALTMVVMAVLAGNLYRCL